MNMMNLISFVMFVTGLFMVIKSFRVFRNHADVLPHEYLELLDYLEWKQGEKLRLEMQRVKNGRITTAHFLDAMANLVVNNHIQTKTFNVDGAPCVHYRRDPRRRGQRIRMPKPPNGQHPLPA